MKVLCLADLHVYSFARSVFFIEEIKKVITEEKPDVIAIAGDVFDNKKLNAYTELAGLGDMPIVFCLGNHEFYQHGGVEKTFEFYKNTKVDNNVHCLDTEGRIDIDGVSFIGNVLWYDGTTKNFPWPDDIIYPGWLDSQIPNFDWKLANKNCKAAISDGFKNACAKTFLLTHCVPHVKLNKHYFRGSNPFNMYSGVTDLFAELSIAPTVSVCGHTHLPAEEVLCGVRCYNIGQDYYGHENKLMFKIVEL